MARHADQQHLDELRQVIERSPGQCIGAVARMLKWSREKVTRGLATLNDQGVLFYEDERGRLWPFQRRRDYFRQETRRMSRYFDGTYAKLSSFATLLQRRPRWASVLTGSWSACLN